MIDRKLNVVFTSCGSSVNTICKMCTKWCRQFCFFSADFVGVGSPPVLAGPERRFERETSVFNKPTNHVPPFSPTPSPEEDGETIPKEVDWDETSLKHA